ncbi:MAG: hypothetical protein ABFD83_11310 [Armatimonadota bacterium]
MDKVFTQMQAEFGSKIEFRKLNWEDKAGQSAIDSLSLANPPASVLADSKGHIVEKFEGARDVATMMIKLRKIALASREKTK